jgi:hypothetical protein
MSYQFTKYYEKTTLPYREGNGISPPWGWMFQVPSWEEIKGWVPSPLVEEPGWPVGRVGRGVF